MTALPGTQWIPQGPHLVSDHYNNDPLDCPGPHLDTGTAAGVRLWGRFTCGGCRRAFTANPDTVPVFPWRTGRAPCCLSCWDMRNRLRVTINERPDDRPPAYPEDYPERLT